MNNDSLDHNSYRRAFLFMRSFVEVVEAMTDRQMQFDFLMAIIKYGLDRSEPVFDNDLLSTLWIAIRPNIESGWSKSDSGRLGGGQPGNQNAKKDKTSKNEQKRAETSNKNMNKNTDTNKNTNTNAYSDSYNPLSVAPGVGRTSTDSESSFGGFVLPQI